MHNHENKGEKYAIASMHTNHLCMDEQFYEDSWKEAL